jgi:hypothetical protein
MWANVQFLIKCFRRIFRKCLCESINTSLGCCLCCYVGYQEYQEAGTFYSSSHTNNHPFFRSI